MTSPASVARGLVALAALLAIATGVRLVARGWPAPARTPEVACAAPVEVREAGVARGGCASDTALAACGALAAGDLVRLEGLACARAPGGMSAPRRLAMGLKLELNRASAAELELLDGIGPRLAAAIVAERQAHGPFGSVSDLGRVRGLGPVLLERLERELEASPATPTSPEVR